MNAQARRKMRFWQVITWFLLTLEKWGWKWPRRAVQPPLMVLELEGAEQEKRKKTRKAVLNMVGLIFRLKVKFWLHAIRFSVWLKRAIEKRATQSVGLIGDGAMLINRHGEIYKQYQQMLEESTPFGPN